MKQPRLFEVSQFKNTISNFETRIHMKNHNVRLQKIRNSKSPIFNKTKTNFMFPAHPCTKKQYLRERNQKGIQAQNERLKEIIKKTKERTLDSYATIYREKSLNITSRKSELYKIERQNEKMHKNLEQLKPIISTKQQTYQYLRNDKHLRRISKSKTSRCIDWSQQK